MKGEINQDTYCSLDCYAPGKNTKTFCYDKECPNYCYGNHYKWPTPEQFKKEYGEEYSDDCPVFTRFTPEYMLGEHHGWDLKPYFEAKEIKEIYEDNFEVVCACTPWGKPPNDWMPE